MTSSGGGCLARGRRPSQHVHLLAATPPTELPSGRLPTVTSAAAAAHDRPRFRPSAIPDPAGSELPTQVRSGTPPASQAPTGLHGGEVSIRIDNRTAAAAVGAVALEVGAEASRAFHSPNGERTTTSVPGGCSPPDELSDGGARDDCLSGGREAGGARSLTAAALRRRPTRARRRLPFRPGALARIQ
jgi:hypothetical protein